MNEKQKNCRKKSYSKPELKHVTLKPEEALATGCKNGGDTSPLDGNPCSVSICAGEGS